MPAGAPSKYTEQKAKDICEITSTTSKSLKTICGELDLKVRTVLDWLSENKEFSQMYAKAKEEQADFLAEEILAIADDSENDYIATENGKMVENREVTNRSRLRVDARKWIASKLKARKYGEKLDVTTDGEKVNAPIITTMLDGKVIDLKVKE